MTTLFTLLQMPDDPVAEIGRDVILKIVSKLGVRLLIDLAALFVLMRMVYYRVYRKTELFFTFYIFNVVIFLICFLLNKVELSMGAAFGLFAVFSMLRYRTEDISIRDMSYLFLGIAIGLISAVTKVKGAGEEYEYLYIGIINFTLVLIAFLLESKLLLKTELVKTITYENIELIHKDRHQELIEDIWKRTGIRAHKVSVNRIDYLKDSAVVKIYYYQD